MYPPTSCGWTLPWLQEARVTTGLRCAPLRRPKGLTAIRLPVPTNSRPASNKRLRVAASLTVAEHLLPRWLVRLAAEHPHTEVSLDAVNTTKVVRQVRSAAFWTGST